MYGLIGYQVYLDCVVTTEISKELIFASAFGGEVSLKSWMGAIENNSKRFHFECFDMKRTMFVKDKRDLYTKRGKVQNATYAHFMHYFIYDKYVQYKDGQIFSHLLIEDEDDLYEQLWERIKGMTATPVLDQWRDLIIGRLFIDKKIVENLVFSERSLVSYSIYFNSQFELNDLVLELLNQKALYLPE